MHNYTNYITKNVNATRMRQCAFSKASRILFLEYLHLNYTSTSRSR